MRNRKQVATKKANEEADAIKKINTEKLAFKSFFAKASKKTDGKRSEKNRDETDSEAESSDDEVVPSSVTECDVEAIDGDGESSEDDDVPCAATECHVEEMDGDELVWIQCEKCLRWFHTFCCNITEIPDTYVCNNCI